MNARSTLLALALAAPSARAQTTQLVSRTPSGSAGNASSSVIKISANQRFAVFDSYASDLVPGDTNGFSDVFVRDLWTNTLTCETLGGDGDSRWGGLSGDGRYVVFQSAATNLVPGDTNGWADIFVRDRVSGITTRVSVDSAGQQGDGPSRFPAISRDGQRVLFESLATNLVAGDTNARKDIFVRDLAQGLTRRVSVASNGQQGDGDSGSPQLSPDGGFVCFESDSTNLDPADTNGVCDAFLHDLAAGTTVLVSSNSSGVPGNGESRYTYLSDGGRVVTFKSMATNLVPGDTNGCDDVFAKDTQTGLVQRVSLGNLGNEGFWTAWYGWITPDARYVIFTSEDPDLVVNDTNGVSDLFLRDLVNQTTERVSLGFLGQAANGQSFYPVISDDARLVVFDSVASNLAPGDTNGQRDVFIRDRWSSFQSLCAGDGSWPTDCPCANNGLAGRGCENSAATGGAQLVASGSTIPDHVRLDVSAELPNSLTIFLQGDAASANGFVFGDGLRCVAGQLLRLYVKGASGGAASAPLASDVSITQRAAGLGAPIALGSLRWVQTYYRDPNAAFCPSATFNASNALRIAW